MTPTVRTMLLLLSSSLLTQACLADPDTDTQDDEELEDEELGTVDQELTPSQAPVIPQRQAFFSYKDGMWDLPRCGAILIDPTHVLSAASCGHPPTVLAHNGSVYPTSAVDVLWKAKWGVADLSVHRLASAAPAGMVPVTMAWTFPGQGAQLKVLGVGNFGGQWNAFHEMRQANATVASSTPQNGAFLTWEAIAESGDQGGGAFWGSQLLGIVGSNTWDGLNQRGKLASIPSNLAWVLDAIEYDLSKFWVFQDRSIVNLPTIQTFTAATVKVCAYACEKTPSCIAFTSAPVPPYGAPFTCKLLGNGQGFQTTQVGSTAGWKL